MPYKDPAKRRAVQARSKNGSRKKSREDKSFIFIDGEGDDGEERGGRQHYFLMGASTGERLVSSDITTLQAFQWLDSLRAEHGTTKYFYVMYGMSYDVEMWLRCLDVMQLTRLMTTNRVTVGDWVIRYYPGKIFELTNRIAHRKITVYDVRGFWSATSPSHVTSTGGITTYLGGFIAALDKELGSDYPGRQLIIDGKLDRGTFRYEDAADVDTYMTAELDRGVDLMESIKAKLDRLGWNLRSWHGSGAIANHLLTNPPDGTPAVTRWQPAVHEPRLLWPAAVGSFYGGWIDLAFIGVTDRKVYQDDINSAYPWAQSMLPPMEGGHWRKYKGGYPQDHAMYYVEWWSKPKHMLGQGPFPFSFRRKDGGVLRPPSGTGWVHGIEVITALKFPDFVNVKILAGFEFVPADSSARQFGWINDLYRQRQELKAAGDPAEMVLKTGYATLYGKEVQQVGAMKFQNLFHGGEITARTRAMMWETAMQNPRALISAMTDSLYSYEPYDVARGTELGQWKDEGVLTESIWCQAGVVFGKSAKTGEWDKRTVRGFGTRLSREDVLTHMADPTDDNRPVASYQTFITMRNAAARNDWDSWRRWRPLTRTMDLRGMQGKRYHNKPLCGPCREGKSFAESMHVMSPRPHDKGLGISHIRLSPEEREIWLVPDGDIIK